MASITLKNIPESLLDRVKEMAARDRRSLNQEVIHLLEQTVLAAGNAQQLQGAIAVQVEAWRQIAGKWRSDETSDEEIQHIYSARSAGRDVKL